MKKLVHAVALLMFLPAAMYAQNGGNVRLGFFGGWGLPTSPEAFTDLYNGSFTIGGERSATKLRRAPPWSAGWHIIALPLTRKSQEILTAPSEVFSRVTSLRYRWTAAMLARWPLRLIFFNN
jgi:hypothetical protein